MNDGKSFFAPASSALTTPPEPKALQQLTSALAAIAQDGYPEKEGADLLIKAYSADQKRVVSFLTDILETNPAIEIVEAIGAVAKHAFQKWHIKNAYQLYDAAAKAGLQEGYFYMGVITRMDCSSRTSIPFARACFIEALDTPLKGKPLPDNLVREAKHHLKIIDQELSRNTGIHPVQRVALHPQSLDRAEAMGIPELRRLQP